MLLNDPMRREAARRAREIALALCAVWLVIQNSLLLVFLLRGRVPALVSALWALAGAALHLIGPLWVIGAASLVGWALSTSLARGNAGIRSAEEMEMEHERAR